MVNHNTHLIQRAVLLKTNEAIEGHLAEAREVTRLQSEIKAENNEQLLEAIVQQTSTLKDVASSFESLANGIVDMIASMQSNQINLNVPKEAIRVNVPSVTLPSMSPKIEPMITIQPSETVIKQTTARIPKSATIKHSDGTQSTITFGK